MNAQKSAKKKPINGAGKYRPTGAEFPRPKLTEAELRRVEAMLLAGMKPPAIAAEFAVSDRWVRYFRAGQRRSSVPGGRARRSA